MKIEDILSEDVNLSSAYKQLSPLQIGLLRKIQADRFDYDTASPQAKEAVEGMIAMGLVNEISLDITEQGLRALNVVNHLGSVDRRNLAQARDQNRNHNNDTHDIPDDIEPIENY